MAADLELEPLSDGTLHRTATTGRAAVDLHWIPLASCAKDRSSVGATVTHLRACSTSAASLGVMSIPTGSTSSTTAKPPSSSFAAPSQVLGGLQYRDDKTMTSPARSLIRRAECERVPAGTPNPTHSRYRFPLASPRGLQ
jgi:hypothetical protein